MLTIMVTIMFVVAAGLIIPSTEAATAYKHMVVTGYVPEYRTGIDWNFYAQHLTDLILFSVEPLADGTIKSYFPIDDDGPASALTKAQEAKKRSIGSSHLLPNSNGINLLLCVGGAGRSGHFSTITSTKEKRTFFLNSLLQILKDKNLNGVDFDWEVPSTRKELHQYQLLLQDAKLLLHDKHQFLVTATVHAWQDLGALAYQSVNRVHLMSYDSQGGGGETHSTYQTSIQDIERLIASKCPASKIVLGVPFYGRGISNPGMVLTYQDLVNKVGADMNPTSDYLGSGVNKIGFNNILTVQKKFKVCIKKKIAGMFAWEIGQDSSDPKTSLTKAISDVRLGIKRSKRFQKINPREDPRFKKKLKKEQLNGEGVAGMMKKKKRRIKRNFDL
jgi:chitinase